MLIQITDYSNIPKELHITIPTASIMCAHTHNKKTKTQTPPQKKKQTTIYSKEKHIENTTDTYCYKLHLQKK